jgi:hypothetical protein
MRKIIDFNPWLSSPTLLPNLKSRILLFSQLSKMSFLTSRQEIKSKKAKKFPRILTAKMSAFWSQLIAPILWLPSVKWSFLKITSTSLSYLKEVWWRILIRPLVRPWSPCTLLMLLGVNTWLINAWFKRNSPDVCTTISDDTTKSSKNTSLLICSEIFQRSTSRAFSWF